MYYITILHQIKVKVGQTFRHVHERMCAQCKRHETINKFYYIPSCNSLQQDIHCLLENISKNAISFKSILSGT